MMNIMQGDLDAVFASRRGKRDELIPILQQVQEQYGYLPQEAMLEIARFTGVPEAQVYAVATFYGQFRLTPKGRRHVTVCRGASCHVQGSPRILKEVEKQLGIKEGETTSDQEYSLDTVACIGICGSSPCIRIDNHAQANMTPEKVAKLFAKGGQV